MILVYCNHRGIGKNWVEVLAKEFGENQVVLAGDVVDKSKVEIAICWKAPEKMLQEYPNLKMIHSLGAGVDHIFEGKNDIPGAKIARIVDPQLSEDMFEFVLSIVLNDLKRLTTYRDQQKEKVWKEKKYKSFKEVSIGILGLGVIGRLVAEKMSEMGFQVMGWSRSEKEIKGVDCFMGTEALEVMLSQADYLINILPLTDQTRGFLNADLFSKLKKGAYVVNVGRGPHVDDDELIEAIDRGHLSGAALDVFHQEPLDSTHPFWDHPKILVTPHIASITNIKTAQSQIFENVRLFRQNGDVKNEVFRGRQY